jgi:hypothetical protein
MFVACIITLSYASYSSKALVASLVIPVAFFVICILENEWSYRRYFAFVQDSKEARARIIISLSSKGIGQRVDSGITSFTPWKEISQIIEQDDIFLFYIRSAEVSYFLPSEAITDAQALELRNYIALR